MEKIKYTISDQALLKAEQANTMQAKPLKKNIILKLMFITMDLVYGFKRTLPKFKVIEILARYPYWAWETGAYHKITRNYARKTATAKKQNEYPLRHIEMGRWAQDNEQLHLLLIDEQLKKQNVRLGFIRFHLIPRLLTLGYYFLTKLMYRLNPRYSFAMNAAFEDHAEKQYMLLVQENQEWENVTIDSEYLSDELNKRSLSDLFRQIGLDERKHKVDSLEEIERLNK